MHVHMYIDVTYFSTIIICDYLHPCQITLLLLSFVSIGVQEKNGFNSCGYTVEEKDTNPAKNNHMLPDGCKMSNGIGICAFISLLLTLYAVFNVNAERKTQEGSLLTGLVDEKQV
jgi:hypothetical protein